MEELFLLAERIVSCLKNTISNEELSQNRFLFQESLIKGSSLSVTFFNITKKIVLNLSTHHLDMPWKIDVSIIYSELKVNYNTIIQNTKHDEIVYEVYPNLLKDPKGLGNKLAIEIANDLFDYLNNKEGGKVI